MAVNPNFTNANAFTSFFGSSGGVPNPLTVSTINANTISTNSVLASYLATSNYISAGIANPSVLAMDHYMLVQNASQDGRVSIRTRWDATDSGTVLACVMGSDAARGTAFIGSEWPGFITQPMSIYGATVQIESDNETFFYMDGNAGALGSISTGTPFISGSNAFSSITAPGGDKANMTALFSTLKALYPSNFS